MGELWRSEEMQLVQLFVQIDAAHDTVDELGKLDVIEFRDVSLHLLPTNNILKLNADKSAFQRNFVNEVKRCDEMERKIRYFEEQVKNEKRDAEAEGREFAPEREPESVVQLEGTSDAPRGQQQPLDELEVFTLKFTFQNFYILVSLR
jgi:V-type H+-transporting ATPase subunit a